MRTLIIRNAKGHETLDLDTEEAIQRLQEEMNRGMLAVAVKEATPDRPEVLTQIHDPKAPAVGEATEVRMFYPLQGGHGR